MVEKQDEQVLAAFIAEERTAIAQALTVSAQRAALAQEAVRLHAQLATVVDAGDVALDDSLHHLVGVVEQHRALTADSVVAWGEVEPVVLAGMELIAAFREAVAPVVEAMALTVKNLSPLLALTDREVEARAAALVATRNVTLATGAVRFATQ